MDGRKDIIDIDDGRRRIVRWSVAAWRITQEEQGRLWRVMGGRGGAEEVTMTGEVGWRGEKEQQEERSREVVAMRGGAGGGGKCRERSEGARRRGEGEGEGSMGMGDFLAQKDC